MNPELKKYIKEEFGAVGRALDLGCGDGADLRGVKDLGWECDGVDLLTGTDLNEVYEAQNAPYDFVYSNYVIQKLTNPKALITTMEKNLKVGGKFFLHTFEATDKIARKTYSEESLMNLFAGTELKVEACDKYQVWDDEPGHEHYHQILQISGVKE